VAIHDRLSDARAQVEHLAVALPAGRRYLAASDRAHTCNSEKRPSCGIYFAGGSAAAWGSAKSDRSNKNPGKSSNCSSGCASARWRQPPSWLKRRNEGTCTRVGNQVEFAEKRHCLMLQRNSVSWCAILKLSAGCAFASGGRYAAKKRFFPGEPTAPGVLARISSTSKEASQGIVFGEISGRWEPVKKDLATTHRGRSRRS